MHTVVGKERSLVPSSCMATKMAQMDVPELQEKKELAVIATGIL